MQRPSEGRPTITIFLASIGAILTAVQIAFLLWKGTPACVSHGCRVVEEAVSLSPIWFNCAGLAFFLILLIAAFHQRRGGASLPLQTLLLAAAAAEGVLVGYQGFVLNTFCPYCLTVFGIILGLNLIQGWRHLLPAAACFTAPFIFMGVLTTDVSSRNVHLDMGTYAVKECANPKKELYLIFSQDCPHCQRVLKALEGCTRCQFHFNPIKPIERPLLPDLVPRKEYDPRVNVATLRILGIDSIPVLIDKTAEGLLFIKGDNAIIRYIEESCFTNETPPLDLQELLGGAEDGACSIDEESACQTPGGGNESGAGILHP